MGNAAIPARAHTLADMTNRNELFIQESMGLMIDRAIESGSYLIELKGILPHGSFMSFCKDHVRVKRSQINNYMNAARATKEQVDAFKESEFSYRGLSGLLDHMSIRDLSGRFVDGNPGGPGRGGKGEHPAMDVKEGRFVYAITNPMIDGWTKIGESENPQIRLSQFHTYAPDDYVLAEYRKLPDGISDKLIHPFIHLRYERKREWFKCSPKEAMEVVDLLIEDADELAPNASRKQLKENVIDRNN